MRTITLQLLIHCVVVVVGLLWASPAYAQDCTGGRHCVVEDLQAAADAAAQADEAPVGRAITDFNALIRDPDDSMASTGAVIPMGTEVEIVETREVNGTEYALVRELLPEGSTAQPREWWTLASNIGSSLEFDPDMVPDRLIPLDGLSGDLLTMAQIYNTRGRYIQEEAERLRIEPQALAAVLLVESSGRGFDDDGRMIIRFENHTFYNQWALEGQRNLDTFRRHFRFGSPSWTGHSWREDASGTWQSFHGDQDAEWSVLDFARGLDGANESALRSHSMGIAQVMGFNHQTLGYDSAQEMFDDFTTGIRPQLDGMIAYIENTRACIDGLRAGNYTEFARGYNGAGQAAHYGTLIQGWADDYEAALALVPDGPAPPPEPTTPPEPNAPNEPAVVQDEPRRRPGGQRPLPGRRDGPRGRGLFPRRRR